MQVVEEKNRFLHFLGVLFFHGIKKRDTKLAKDIEKTDSLCYNITVKHRGVAQLVARDVWDVDAAGSNPVTPTKNQKGERLSPF